MLGLPTYFAATLAFLKATNGNNPILLIIGLLCVVTAYNAWYKYLFPDHVMHGQWLKVALLVAAQIVVGGGILAFAWLFLR